jgi:arylsulfatase A-like enzyme
MTAACSPAHRPEVRNVVLVSIDTLRPDHLQTYGYERETSPFLLELSGRGVVFEQAIAQAPWTLPSHGAMLNSQHPSSLGSGAWERPGRIPPEAVSIAEVLSEHGWRTRAVVDGGFLSKTFGLDQGFERYTEDRGDARSTVEKGLRWVDRVEGEPFLLFLHTYDVHEYSPPEDTARLFVRPYDGFVSQLGERRAMFVQDRALGRDLPTLGDDDRCYVLDLYDAGIRAVDEALRELWEGLEQRGLADETLIVITSDHGEELFEHGGSGHGYNLHDENVRVPLIMLHSSIAPRRVAAQVRSIDIGPTIAELCGLEAPAEWEGTSLVPALAGRKLSPLPAVSEQAHVPFASLRTGSAKYIRGVAPAAQLYDLERDPSEADDLASSGDPREAELDARLEEWLRAHAAWPPPDPGEVAEMDPDLVKELRELGYLGGD